MAQELKAFLVALLALLLATYANAAYVLNSGLDSPQDRTQTFNPLHQLTLFTLNKFPISVDTVKACGQNADAETRVYCALKETVPDLLDSSQGAVNVRVRIGSADLQTISKTPKPLYTSKETPTAETFGFETDGEQYNAIFIDQGTLYTFAGEPSADVAIAIIRYLMDESHSFPVNSDCRIRIAANGKAIAFKNCQILDAKKPSIGKLEYQKIQCEKPPKTGIIGLASPINGQCPNRLPATGPQGPAAENAELSAPSGTSADGRTDSTECDASDFVPPIDNPQPRLNDPIGDYWWGATRNNQASAGHHEGVDVKGQDGLTKVRAVGSGTVEQYTTEACGNAVLIKHDCTIDGKAFRTKYCHLNTQSKKPAAGSKVTKGQVIGMVGKTGNAGTSKVTHLHIEYIAGGKFTPGKASVGGDFDPVEKGFMPKSFGIPGKRYAVSTTPRTDNSGPDPTVVSPGGTRPASEVPILTLHHADAAKLTPQFEFLKKNGYSTISLKELESKRASNAKVSKKLFTLTVDDGYEDAYTVLLPLLKKYGFHATFFVITNGMHLTPVQLKEMAQSGRADIQSHTNNMHPADASGAGRVTLRTYAEIKKDLELSRTKIKGWLGASYEVNLLAWPFGRPQDISDDARKAARELNFITYGHIPSSSGTCQRAFPAASYRARDRCEFPYTQKDLATMLGHEDTTTVQGQETLQFAEKETLPTVAEYIQYSLSQGVFRLPDPRCDSGNTDANGFFGYRNRKIGSGCVHAGLDIRGRKKDGGPSLYNLPVKAMMAGKIVRINTDFQGVGKQDYSIVVQSGPWQISYGHITLGKHPKVNRGLKVGDEIKKGDVMGVPHPQIQQTNYGGEVDVKILYTGSEQKLRALTVKELSKNPKYKPFFDNYDTKKILQSSDFTFGVSNYDDYFLWEAYTADLKALTATEPTQTTSQQPNAPPSSGRTSPTTTRPEQPTQQTSNAAPSSGLNEVCVYYYLDANDGAKDKFFDAGIAAYAGSGGACLVGRAALSRTDIQYPSGYDGYVNTNQLPSADSYEGCYVAKIPLAKHGDQQPTGVNVKLFLSKNKDAFAPAEGYLEKGIARSVVDEKTIGELSCQPPGSSKAKTKPVDTTEAGKQFLKFAMELNGLPYPADLKHIPVLPKETDCATIPTYAFAKMLQAGYSLPQAFYDELKKTTITRPGGKTIKTTLPSYLTPIAQSITLDMVTKQKVKIPAAADVPVPHNSDTWGELLERLGWEVPLNQVQPGDIVLFSYANGGQCSGSYSEQNPYGSGGSKCWRNWGHIEVAHSGSGSQITTFGSNRPAKVKGPNEHDKIDKAFRFQWIPPGSGTGAKTETRPAAGSCTDAGLAAKLAQMGLKIETSISGKSTMRNMNDWTPKIRAYSKRHYGEDTAELTPSVIVEHYTVTTGFAWNLVETTSFDGETPGLASHFEVDGVKIYQILPINVRSRGAYAINHRAINIEIVAMNAADLATRQKSLDTAAKLTAAIMAQCGIPLDKVYSHTQVAEKKVPEFKDLVDPRPYGKSDPGENNMKTIKDKIRAMGTLTSAQSAR